MWFRTYLRCAYVVVEFWLSRLLVFSLWSLLFAKGELIGWLSLYCDIVFIFLLYWYYIGFYYTLILFLLYFDTALILCDFMVPHFGPLWLFLNVLTK